MDDSLSSLVAAVRSGRSYRAIVPALVARIGRGELAKGRKIPEAVKATKRKLHQVAGAYLDMGVRYERWLEELRRGAEVGELRQACAQVMRYHASTRERLPVLDSFYTTLLEGLPPVRSVLDVGCGLNPLALPWMPLAPEAEYVAYDIYEDMAAFLNAFFALAPVQGKAEALDITGLAPTKRFDLALILKTVPCLEQIDKDASARLLDAVRADCLLISFPVHSLGGRDKGMWQNYEARFDELEGRNWQAERFEFKTELVFRIRQWPVFVEPITS